MFNDVRTEVVIIKLHPKMACKDPILCVSDLQECATLNKKIFETAIYILKEQCGDFGHIGDLSGFSHILEKTTLVLAGDFYGESYYDEKLNKKIQIRGKSGSPNYDDLKINNLPRVIVYGNHDVSVHTDGTDSIRILPNGTRVTYAHFIESKEFPTFINDTTKVLEQLSQLSLYSQRNKNKKSKERKDNINNICNILVTHETPYLKNGRKGNKNLTKLVKMYVQAPFIHIFGHCHLKSPIHLEDGILFINCDSRFILIF